MSAKVPDASALGAIVFSEPRRREALSLLEGADLYAPTILAYELTSIARTKIVRYPNEANEVENALAQAFTDIYVNWVEPNHNEVLRIALETHLSTYDASYLYVSRMHGIPLVTFDERLRRAFES